jgi:hypothetical protein
MGRWVGGTVYPGLMWTAGFLHHVANNWLNIPVDIKEVTKISAISFYFFEIKDFLRNVFTILFVILR